MPGFNPSKFGVWDETCFLVSLPCFYTSQTIKW